MAYLYACSVLLSAFLLFQVQPMIGKYILPWFGGTPTVWSTVLLFFQALLTGGYAYAYWLLDRRRERLQAIVHLALLGLSLGLLAVAALEWPSPLTPDARWRPAGGELPVWGVFRVLAVSVGIPYFLLSANSTLMQAWVQRDGARQTPYRLYALSNGGSLAALISYPILFEPNLALRAQGWAWAAAYAAFAIGTGYLALRVYRRARSDDLEESKAGEPGEERRPGVGMHLLWLGLAACASTLLVSVSNQITQEVAPIPFLWVLPLTIYLLTFILAFAGGQGYSRRLYLVAFFLISLVSVWMLVKWPPFSMAAQIAIYGLLLFACCMLCHNELYRLRPHRRFLPSFYLMVALGGAAGGCFVNLLAPYLFATGFWELQWAAVACGVLLAIILQSERTPPPRRRGRRRERGARRRSAVRPAAAACSAAVLLLAGAVALYMRAIETDTLLARRNFYGVLRVWETNSERLEWRAHQLTHGKTAHGFQFLAGERRGLPTTYYAEKSGVGLSILSHPARPGSLRIGALGLGVGVIAAYGQPGDVIRFYEINPDVIRIAEGEGGYFSFLRDSQAEIEIVPGDARVSLERELASDGSQGYDLLVLDTFNGDSMPLHLLTRQAFEVYLRHLKPDGIVAINVSNRFFRLHLEVYRLADALGLASARIEDRGDGLQSYDSVWMLVARDRRWLELPAVASRTAPRPAIPARLPVWTDDLSNLLQILR